MVYCVCSQFIRFRIDAIPIEQNYYFFKKTKSEKGVEENMVLEQAERKSKRNLGISLSMPDSVNRPSHYQGKFGLEVIDVVRNFAGDLTAIQGFYWGNAMKWRGKVND